jgi:hypothetical protein
MKRFLPSSQMSAAKGRRRLAMLLPLLSVCTLLAPLSLRAQTPTLVLSNKWTVAAGSTANLSASGDNTRGIAINKATGNVLYTTRSSPQVSVISGVNGSDVTVLNNSGISGGAVVLDQVRVADGGVIYAANLQGAGVQNFKIYRWNSEEDGQVNPPTVAFDNSVALTLSNLRYGDSMDIRGGGTNTQIIVSSSSATAIALFTTVDGTNFTPVEISHTLGAGQLGYMLTFDGTNNVVFGKQQGSTTLHYVAFTNSPPGSALITNITVADGNFIGGKAASSNGVKFVVGVVTSTSASTVNNHRFKAYTLNLSAPSASISGDLPFPAPNTGNGNTIAASDVALGMAVGIDVNNGIVATTISFATNIAPSIVGDPQGNTNVLQGGYFTFSVSASGTDPLRYQWRFDDTNNIAGATNASLTLTNLQFTNSGLYRCVVTNTSGSVTSANATLTIVPSVLSSAAVPLWTKSASDLFFLANDNNHRGLAYDPMTDHVIVVSRTPSNGVHVLNAATGSYLRSLDMSGVTGGGTFLVSLVGCGDDGAIYVANLDTAGLNYEIYRWADDASATVATVAFGPSSPGLGDRVGDTLAVRRGGTNTQILAASRNVTTVALFTTFDGMNYSPTVIDVNTQPASFAGLGIAFGDGDTFWSKSSAFQFRHIAFDLIAGTNGLLQTFAAGQNTSAALGVDPLNDLVAGVALATPDNVELYDVHDVVNGLVTEPNLIDQDFFKTDNVNGNGTGAVAFDVNGGRLFALDSNNGLLALKVVARLKHSPLDNKVVFNWTGPSALQSSTNVATNYTDIGGASSPYTNTSPSALFFRLRR